ncbi:MAG TPA: response regulator [Thermoanaerobaculia bacterium]|nr:response regulator [Thermoanaerobaculia bacterium]
MSRIDKPFVLIVDDNEATITLMTALLHRECAVDAATSGRAAIENLHTRNYDAMILDLRMPDMDGFAVLDFLQRERPEMLRRTIVCTALLMKSELERVAAYEVCALIAKPFEVEQLLDAVRSCFPPEHKPIGPIFSTGMVLLLADLLRQRLM